MQHVRTSGLRKEREIFLIDEMLELRRHRKQAHTYFTKKIAAVDIEKQELGEKIESMILEFRSAQKAMETQVLRAEKDSDTRIEAERKAKDEELKSVKTKYEKKLQKLESKLQELVEAKKRREDTEVTARVAAQQTQLQATLSSEYDKRVDKYVLRCCSLCL